MTNTTNYGFNIVEGSDIVNPLTQLNPNFENLDSDLKAVSDLTVGKATELKSNTVHELTRIQHDNNVFRFTATSNFTAGETFLVDGVQVTALAVDGSTLTNNCYVIGSEVLCTLRDTLLTVYVTGTPAEAGNAQTLDGKTADEFATAEALTEVNDLAVAASESITQLNNSLTKIKTDLYDSIVKSQIFVITTDTINGYNDITLTLTLPTSYTRILSVVPIGIIPVDTWNTVLNIKSVSLDGTQMYVRTAGANNQKYTVEYLVLYN